MQHVRPLDEVVVDLGRLADPVHGVQAAMGIIIVGGQRRRAIGLQEERAIQAVVDGVEVMAVRMGDPGAVAGPLQSKYSGEVIHDYSPARPCVQSS